MTWRGFWEAIGSIFEDFLLIPLDALRALELESWWAANFISWIFVIIGSIALVYWLKQLIAFDENTEKTYTYDERI